MLIPPPLPYLMTCPCDNETIETREHILTECPRFAQHQDILEKVSRSIAMPSMLSSKEGIEALSKFLHKVTAFTRMGSIPTTPPPLPLNMNQNSCMKRKQDLNLPMKDYHSPMPPTSSNLKPAKGCCSSFSA